MNNYKLIDNWRDIFSEDDVNRYISCFGDFLPDPLSSRIDIQLYTNKLINNAKIYFLKNDNLVVGVIGFYINDEINFQSYISLISVLPNFQSQGCGTILLNSCIAARKNAGMCEISLRVHSANLKAQRFYAANGFSSVKIDQKSNKLIMIKKL
ncbi:MAG: GNAT family N-acetyltransferase [Negativicutes bacterium]|nr:GNAT family N-acetyltransferase [Negativicutes bacterium]